MLPDTDSISENERTAASLAIALAIVIGLMSPGISGFFFEYLLQFLFFVVVFSFCALNANILDVIGCVDRQCWIALAWQMAGLPLIVSLVCLLLNTDYLTTTVLIATVTAGSVFASPALAHLIGLDRKVAIQTMLLSTFIMPISLLFFGELNGVLPRDIDLFNYVQHVVYFLLLPMVMAICYWQALPSLGPRLGRVAQHGMHWAATLALVGFCVGVMYKLHWVSAEDGALVMHYILLVAIVVVAVYIVTGLLFIPFGRISAFTFGMLAANRNVALSFVLIIEILPREVLAYVAVAQFPIFLLPIMVRLAHLEAVRARIAVLKPSSASGAAPPVRQKDEQNDLTTNSG